MTTIKSENSIIGIPIVDLNKFISGNEILKHEFVNELGNAYEEIGFVAVKNHGISQELISEMYENTKLFFDLPIDVKQKYEELSGGQRGYTSFGKEHAKGKPSHDLKEFWHFGQYVDEGDSLVDFYPANKIVTELSDFNKTGKSLYKELEICSKKILSALSLFLTLDEHYFDDRIYNGNSILRPIHYPPILSEPNSSIRAGEHEDINLITLLVGSSSDGLEVMNKNGEWISVKALNDMIVVNVGDMLQRLTNNRLKSTTHRVVNPPKEKWDEPRYSIPFFLHPRPDVRLDCLPSCITPENPLNYEPISANEYLLERLKEIGLIK